MDHVCADREVLGDAHSSGYGERAGSRGCGLGRVLDDDCAVEVCGTADPEVLGNAGAAGYLEGAGRERGRVGVIGDLGDSSDVCGTADVDVLNNADAAEHLESARCAASTSRGAQSLVVPEHVEVLAHADTAVYHEGAIVGVGGGGGRD